MIVLIFFFPPRLDPNISTPQPIRKLFLDKRTYVQMPIRQS